MMEWEDKKKWLDMDGIGEKIKIEMDEKRIEGRDERFNEWEEKDVELGDIGKLKKWSVEFEYEGWRKKGGKVGRKKVELGIGEKKIEVEDRGRIGKNGGMLLKWEGEGFVDKVEILEIEELEWRWKMGKLDGNELLWLK